MEKAFKSFFEYRGMKTPKIHDLVRLSDLLNLKSSNDEQQLYKGLSYYYIASRYSERIKTLSDEITKERSLYIIKKSEGVYTWIKSMIPFLY